MFIPLMFIQWGSDLSAEVVATSQLFNEFRRAVLTCMYIDCKMCKSKLNIFGSLKTPPNKDTPNTS